MAKKNKRNKKNFGKNIFVIFLLFFTFSFVPTKNTEAFWGEIIQAFLDNTLEVLTKQSLGGMQGAAKKQAANMIIKQTESMLSGNSLSDTKFITNWEDYLISQPTERTNRYINDQISYTLGGKGSSNYRNANGSNYLQLMEGIAKESASENESLQVNFSNSDSIFRSGNNYNFSGLNSYMEGVNNPWAMDFYIKNKYNTYLEEEKEIAQAKSVAYSGFKGGGDEDGSGQIYIPGSILYGNTVNAYDLGNKTIAGATSMGEIISTAVSQMITQSVQAGIGNVKKSINKEINSVNSRVNQNINNSVNQYGPSAAYQSANRR